MNLNDTQAFKSLDTENMIAHIDGLPDQMQQAWQLGSISPLPAWEASQANCDRRHGRFGYWG